MTASGPWLARLPLVVCLTTVIACSGGNPSTTPSSPSAAATVPSAPTEVGAVAGDAQAVVSFTAPPSDGGAAITSYTAVASPGGSTASGAGSPITVTGLTNGTPHFFRVTATNSAGIGPASSPLEAVTPTSPLLEAPPVLSVSIVDLAGTYDPATGRLGGLNCTFKFATDPNDRWCFGSFGSSHGASRSSYDYKVAAGTPVRAAAAGVVTRIEADTNPLYPGEFEIETRNVAGGTCLVIYDHVKNLTVAMGSTVAPAMVLGTAGIHTSNAATWGHVELSINRTTQQSSVSQGPRAFGTESFNADQEKALAAHNAANPAFAASSVCLAETVP